MANDLNENTAKKILFFSENGDPGKKATWSNVPYCFCKALENSGYIVVKINLLQNKILRGVWNRAALRMIRLIFKGAEYDFSRTRIANALVNRRISKIVKKHSDATLCIFTTFSFYNKHSNIPSLLFCDWSYETLLERIGRKPYFFEKWFIKSQREVLSNATLCVSLFPKCADMINNQMGREIVKWGGISAPNILDDEPFNDDEILEASSNSNIILFVGNRKYLEGAKLLVKAYNLLKESHPELELHIIGLNSSSFGLGIDKSDVHFHGYLSKDIPEDCSKYYDLIRRAGVFCNPTEVWGGFSSTIEAMYYYTPVVVSPYEEFVAQFGKEINFGQYNRKFNEKELASSIAKILNSTTDERRSYCINAHEVVKGYHWNEYSKRLLDLLKEETADY